VKIRIKICGITRAEDALKAAELGVDAIGFVFHLPSPRYIEPAAAAAIIDKLPGFLTTVGVFVDLEQEQVRRIASEAHLDRLQLCGSESPEYCSSLGLRWIKAFRLKTREDIKLLAPYGSGRDFLLDSYLEGVPGGTGETFNWEWAKEAGKYGRIILAGGLTPDNVARAIRAAMPAGVDVSSGVEKSPGVKDQAKMAAFVETVRNCI
jgi:phosphoribosylanthranilate isomerase